MPDVVILVPRRAGNPYRDGVWAWLEPWWAEQFPDWRLVVGDVGDDGPFLRSAALNAAAAAAGDWDVALCIDADVLTDTASIRAAVAAALGTGYHVLGYNERRHLHKQGTAQILDGYRGNWTPFTRTHLTDSCSSMNAVRRDLWDKVGGFDEEFRGWGWEDIAFRIATEAASAAPLVKITGTCWHLWHPKSPENDNNQATFLANQARGTAYKQARWNWPAIQQLRSTT